MIFRSNLIAPDLAPHFKLLSEPRGYSFGHDVPSDPDFDPNCGFWTHDEAAILYTVAKQVGGEWLDIGCRFGWTSAHIAAAGARIVCLDPLLALHGPQARFEMNMEPVWRNVQEVVHITAAQFFDDAEYFDGPISGYDGFVVDGCHDHPEPCKDATGCVRIAKDNCVILLHDFWGAPVREAVKLLMDSYGFKARIYWTPNGVALCWRYAAGHEGPTRFKPPDHTPDPAIYAAMRTRLGDFDLARCV